MEENYIVSARKYRPSTFQSVAGQKSLTTTLKNAIQNQKLAHAYLFCGPRGVGKTTCARIFAKTINCRNPQPDGEACNECESCKAFNENRSYNIYELDAASNNSVDDIRSLTEQVRIPPQIGKYKVYIIDEVHMLSTAAFNAFLKTLEEPPHHAIFILATTEKHKIIPTILSRCQIYDFSRISINDIVDNLTHIAENEHVSYEPEALNAIAQKADGGMRDALSIFDQVVSFSGSNVTYMAVIENLNVLDYDYYFRLTEAILAGDVSQSLLIFDEILRKGFDGQQIISGLSGFFRDLLVCKDPATIVLFEVGDAVKEKYLALAQKCPVDFLYKALEWSNETDLNYRYSKSKRLLLELLLIRLSQYNRQPTPVDDKKKIAPLTIDNAPLTIDNGSPTVGATLAVALTETPTAPPTAPPTETPTTPPKKGKLPSISLKNPDANKPVETAPSVAQSATVLEETFTKEDLARAWKAFAEKEDDTHLKMGMLNITPELQDNKHIQIGVFNQTQLDKLTEKQSEIKQFLAQQLQNTQIELNILITDNPADYLPYTNRDKYDFMLQKNPKLETFVNNFNLVLD
ncbi:MAG: DNA polymerase III subunit gamma/tau [Candidatus Symbiothrix sp.]|jgi:DNA polymerase-3 subunit gamma/tau|nr:DNA polymerase III subunit gamma/tau [Candidatus Symbiothrix sp.]